MSHSEKRRRRNPKKTRVWELLLLGNSQNSDVVRRKSRGRNSIMHGLPIFFVFLRRISSLPISASLSFLSNPYSSVCAIEVQTISRMLDYTIWCVSKCKYDGPKKKPRLYEHLLLAIDAEDFLSTQEMKGQRCIKVIIARSAKPRELSMMPFT